MAAIAVAAGVRADICMIDVPSLQAWSMPPTRPAGSEASDP